MSSDGTRMKRCAAPPIGCGRLLGLALFHHRRSSRDGRASICTACTALMAKHARNRRVRQGYVR
jgi:hypothetical protein